MGRDKHICPLMGGCPCHGFECMWYIKTGNTEGCAVAMGAVKGAGPVYIPKRDIQKGEEKL